MGEAHVRTPTPPKPLNRFRYHVKYITTSPQGVDVQNLVGIDSAVTDLRMREKTRFVWIFLLIIVKKLNSLKHLVRTTVAESHN